MLLLKKKKTSNVTIESNIDFRLILTCSLKFQYIWVSCMNDKKMIWFNSYDLIRASTFHAHQGYKSDTCIIMIDTCIKNI